MIDIENEIYTMVAETVRGEIPDVTFSGEYVNAPSQFPFVSFIEQDNYTSTQRLDSGEVEKYSTITYEVNVYSNKKGVKKQTCRKIMNCIDKVMLSLNFKRLSLAPVPNMENGTIYRIVARYRAETDGNLMYRG